MLSALPKINISFKSNSDVLERIPTLDERYTTAESKAKTVTILGSSKTSDSILSAMNLCSRLTKDLVAKGYNIQTGNGKYGIMGSAYRTAQKASACDIFSHKPTQNLAIVTDPLYGIEDLKNCTLIGKATSEADRIDKFSKTSDTFVIFPGSAATLQEAASLIRQNEYMPPDKPLKKIILVGKKYFAGIAQQYRQIFNSKLLKHKQKELFKVLDTKDEVLKEITKA